MENMDGYRKGRYRKRRGRGREEEGKRRGEW